MTLQEGWSEWLKFSELALQSLRTIAYKVHRNALKSLAQLLSVAEYEKIDLLISHQTCFQREELIGKHIKSLYIVHFKCVTWKGF